jgi:hypothetical protein
MVILYCFQVGTAGITVTRRMGTLCQTRIPYVTMDLFGTMNVLRIPALKSTVILDHPGF